MNRIFITIFFLFFFISNSLAEIIKNVDVKGNKRISKETIILFGNIKLNQEINSGDLNVEFNGEPSVNGVKIFNLHIHSKNLKEFASV